MGTRDATFETIVVSATGLFLAKGISAVAMGDIAEAAGCTRRTLYRYFAAKEDLVYETVIRLLEVWNLEQREAFAEARGTGLERFGSFLYGLVDRLERRKDVLRLMGEFDFVFRDELGYRPGKENSERFADAAGFTERLMDGLLREGVADGSVRGDANPAVIVPTVSTVLWGTAQRVAIRDRMMREEFGFSGSELIRAQIDLYLRALSA